MKLIYSLPKGQNPFGRASHILKKALRFVVFAILFAFNPGALSACDTSGFVIESYTDNGDGTFTVTVTIKVAGDFTTDCGSTWGFFWEAEGVNILSVSPPSLTSNNGTTLNAVITGNNVTWGDPNGGFPTIPFVDAQPGSNTNDESFTVSIVLDGQSPMWNGGGQEANTCPNSGCSANPANYEGEFPCFEPFIQIAPIVTPTGLPPCPGDAVQITVIASPPYLVDEYTWEDGQTGNPITVFPDETTTYSVTASNICSEVTESVTIEVTPFPTIEALNDNIVACEGFPVIMEVNAMHEVLVEWEPTGGVGPIQIVAPTTSPSIFTATASNHCGEADVDILVTLIPPPSINIITPNKTICEGDTIKLVSDTSHTDLIEWIPSGSNKVSIFVSPDTTTEYVVIATSDCGADFDTVTVSVAEASASNVTLQACKGKTVNYNGIPLAAGTQTKFTFPNFAGCDSVVTVTVNQLPTYSVPVQLFACANETVQYNGETLAPGTTKQYQFQTINGCDSTVTVTVTKLPTYTSNFQPSVCANASIFYEGVELFPGDEMDFTLTALNGCDSLVKVKVKTIPVYDIGVNLKTCTGTTIPYLGQNLAPGSTTTFNLTSAKGCDSIVTVFVEELAVLTEEVTLEACTGSTINYNGQQLQPNTVENFTFTSVLGCDSVVTVTVNEVTAIEKDRNLSACAGTSAIFDNTPVPAGTTMDFSYTTSQGCDSIVTVTVAELPTYNLPLTLQACTGTSIMYEGIELDAGTTTPVTLSTFQGCDSIMNVTVEGIDAVLATTTLPACAGDSALFNGQLLEAGTSQDFTFESSLGCDSILTVNVDAFPNYNEPLTLFACTGTTVEFQGTQLPPNTTVNFTLETIHGCDSVLAVTVEEVDIFETELDFETCANTFITYNGQQLSPGTQEAFTFTSVNGCDSIVTVSVALADEITGNVVLSACANSTVAYNGQDLLPGSVHEFTFQTAAGCDSVVSVVVFEEDTFASNLSLKACPNGTVMYNGTPLAPNTTTPFTLTAVSNGCDSVVTVSVSALPTFTGQVTLEACTGSTAMYNGQALPAGTVQDFTFQSILNGCDSVVTVTVNEVQQVTGELELAACTGETVPFMGEDIPAGGSMVFNLTSAQGCDSLLTVSVMELLPQVGTFQTAICAGETYLYNGQTLAPGSTTDITLQAANGCDSVVTVTVDELLPSFGAVSLQGCPDEILLYNNTEITPGTSMEFTFTNSDGCDSIVTVTGLPPLPAVETEETIQICEGESVIIFGAPVSSSGTYQETYVSMNGCDSIHSITLDVADDLGIAFDDELTINLGESIQLYPIIASNDVLMYSWSPDSTLSCLDCPNPIASPLYTTTYFVTVTDEMGCNASANVQLFVKKERDIYIPNSFSPNGDGINEVFMIFSGQNIVANVRSLQVFSRWGESVFQIYNFPPNDPTYGWDGKYRGEFLNPAVYTYFAEVEFVDGVVTIYKGDVNLMR